MDMSDAGFDGLRVGHFVKVNGDRPRAGLGMAQITEIDRGLATISYINRSPTCATVHLAHLHRDWDCVSRYRIWFDATQTNVEKSIEMSQNSGPSSNAI